MANFVPLKKTMNIFRCDCNLIDLFAFNEFKEDIEFLRPPEWDKTIGLGKTLDDQDLIQILNYFSQVHDYEPSFKTLGNVCFLLSMQHRYHPIKRYLEASEWDQTKRLDMWLTKALGCSDNVYTRAISAKFLIAAVKRVYEPGCKFDYMLILEGTQGAGKSTLIEELAPDFYLDTNFGHRDKDLIDSMRGSFIIEISELSGMNKKDVDWLKSFLSKKVDRVRLAYAVRSKDFKRKCVFMGTYNPSGNNMYLRDDTGNRRFWPVECGEKLDITYVKENRAQLFAEAIVRYKSGEKIFIEDEAALEILAGIHKERELESPTYHTIKEWLKHRGDNVRMNDIISDCLKISMANKMPRDILSVSTTIGIIMRKLRWRKGTNDDSDKYFAPENHKIESQSEVWSEVWNE